MADTWVQGHTGSLVSGVGWSVEWRPEFMRLKAERAGSTWIHFGIPVTHASGRTPRLEAVRLAIRTWGTGCIDELQVWSGAQCLETIQEELRAGTGGARSERGLRHGGLAPLTVATGEVKLDSGPLGISIQVRAQAPRDAVAIAAVGATIIQSRGASPAS